MLSFYFVFGFACTIPSAEHTFNSLIQGMLLENNIPVGDILDVGADKGEWSCLYACSDSSRTVHAVDPSKKNLDDLSCENVHNIEKHVMMLDKHSSSRIEYSSGYLHKGMKVKKSAKGNVEVSTVDELFKTKKIGFMHLDVEGFELNVLYGSLGVLKRDRPILSVEVFMYDMASTKSLLQFLEKENYSLYVVHEICGWRKDCRNIICLPKELIYELNFSPILNIAARSETIKRVNSTTIFNYKANTYLRGFYDTTRALIDQGSFICNTKGKKWKQNTPCD